jgi:hypothetical protein
MTAPVRAAPMRLNVLQLISKAADLSLKNFPMLVAPVRPASRKAPSMKKQIASQLSLPFLGADSRGAESRAAQVRLPGV